MIEQAGEWFSERPLGFVDVGARGGVHPLVEPIAVHVNVLAFEPDVEACAELNAVAHPWAWFQCLPVALSNHTGAATLWRCAASTNDSLRPVNRGFVDRYSMEKFRQTGQTQLTTTTLDRALEDHPGQGEFIKLDTQGTEYEVLLGAQWTLTAWCAAVWCEVEFAPIYQGQALFSDIESFLRHAGFSFVGFDALSYRSRTPWRGRERLLHADALFIKDPLEPRNADVPLRQKQVAATVARLCGYDDFAKEIVDAID